MTKTMPPLFLFLPLILLPFLIPSLSSANMDLKSLITEGLKHNIKIKNQRVNLEKAKIELSNSKKANLPTISLSSGLTYSHASSE